MNDKFYKGGEQVGKGGFSYETLKEYISEIALSKNNIDGEIAHLRDTFLGAEKDYVTNLLGKDRIKDIIFKLNKSYSSDMLFEKAQELMHKVEAGEVQDEEMEEVEFLLTLLLAAIQDKVLEREKVLYPGDELDEPDISRGGRGR